MVEYLLGCLRGMQKISCDGCLISRKNQDFLKGQTDPRPNRPDTWGLDFFDALASDMAGKSFDIEFRLEYGHNTDGKASVAEASCPPKVMTAATIILIVTGPFAIPRSTRTSDTAEPLAESPEPEDLEKSVATYEPFWHNDHNPMLVPREGTQKYWRSDSKELVQFYTIREPSTKSSDESGSDDTCP